MVTRMKWLMPFALIAVLMLGGCQLQPAEIVVTTTTATQSVHAESTVQSTAGTTIRHEIGDGADNEIDVGWFEDGGDTTAVSKSEPTTKTTKKSETQSTRFTESTRQPSSQTTVSTRTTTTRALENSNSGFGDLV